MKAHIPHKGAALPRKANPLPLRKTGGICGSGLELDAIFQRFPELEVTGIDLSAEMLARLAQKHGEKSLRLIQGDYFQQELGTGYDAVISFETLHHFTAARKRGLFARIRESLRPGGIYLECDYMAASPAIEDLVFAECRRRRERDGIPPEQFVHFDTPLTLEHELQTLRDGGFSTAELVGFLPQDQHTAMLRAVRQNPVDHKLGRTAE
ncbi:MAG: class I SAM-dependent methyltransferase [Oscillospiraceae bacterium]|jgi:tRNA (cmo5U34)-methyltransferase|nr:class I SAM-dependent methyltransferase [Oscillospiraceae bacterium]